jgi:hypothetical protein
MNIVTFHIISLISSSIALIACLFAAWRGRELQQYANFVMSCIEQQKKDNEIYYKECDCSRKSMDDK